MLRRQADGVAFYRFEGLQEFQGQRLNHAALTRIGGVSEAPYDTLNLGHTVGDNLGAVEENHRRVAAALEVEPTRFVSPYQVHGAEVAVVGAAHRGTVQPEVDALITDEPQAPMLMRFADCTPVLFYDPARNAAGIAHAGWRGVVNGIIPATVEALVESLGCKPGRIWAGIGPTIGPCCYEVGPDVALQIEGVCPKGADVVRRADGRTFVDLPAAVHAQLEIAGVERIEDSQLCTACCVDEFFSHRAEGGRTGRFGVVMELL